MASTFRARWVSYTELIEALLPALWTLWATIVSAVRQQGFVALTKISKLLDENFAVWYHTNSVHFVRFEDSTAVPKLVAAAEGTVLELGPGPGNQLPRLDQTQIHHVYGVEPNHAFIPLLRDKAAECGLEGKYTIIPCGVEDVDSLKKSGLEPGSVDTILSMQVLCSVSRPEQVAKELYRLLRPGGKLIFWEHHCNHDWVTRIVQNIWNTPWSILIGGCSINRDILGVLRAAGEWQGLGGVQSDEKPQDMLPRSWGILVKPLVHE